MQLRGTGLAAFALMMLSGFAGLGYQIIWTQQFALWLGHESAAVLAVVTAFFGGLALGSLAFGRRIEASGQPVAWYAGCELAIAAWSAALAVGLPRISTWMLEATGVQPGPLWQWTVAFAGSLLLLLPATAAMGATLPAMARIASRLHAAGRPIAALYACNTAGATIGVVASAGWLIPTFGLRTTAGVCVAANVLCALGAVFAFGVRTAGHAGQDLGGSGAAAGGAVLLKLAYAGFLGIGYEVLVVRVLSEVAEDTVYTFAALLAVYLLGTAAGAAAYQRWLARAPQPARLDRPMLCALSASCLLGTATLWAAAAAKEYAAAVFGPGMPAAIAAEAVPAILAFALPTFVMGALFSHWSNRAHASGRSLGNALGFNTAGAACAPAVLGIAVVPAIGPKTSLLLVCAGYLALISWREWRSVGVVAVAGSIAAAAIWAPPLRFVDVPDGGRIVTYEDGVMAAVSVVEDAAGVARLRINNRQQEGTSASLRVDGRQALLPMLLHRRPARLLFLGLGTGVTATTAAQDPNVHVTAVELLPEVITASRQFAHVFEQTAPNPRLSILAADARRFVKSSGGEFDVIVSDNFHPARSGSGALYTIEHFRAVQARLADGGLFCQWLPLHQLDLTTLRSIVQSYIKVYPDARALLANFGLETPVLGLVGRRRNGGDARDPGFDLQQLRTRLAASAPHGMAASFGLEDEFALLGGFIAGPDALRRFAGNAAPNTDDRPRVAYDAPRVTYAPDSLPRERLIELLQELSIAPEELMAPPLDPAWRRRLADYWLARNRFIAAGASIKPTGDVREMLDQVRAPLFGALRISPDFRPAYDPLLSMAANLAQSDPAGSRELLATLARLQPMRPEAKRLLDELDAAKH